jgi:hypothetical protein
MMMASMRAFCERGSTDTHQQLWSYAYHPPPKSNSVDNEWFQQHALQNKVRGGPGYFISKGVGYL